MAHFAQIQNGIVINVIVVNNDVLIDNTGNESEDLGIEFCKKLFGQDTQWKQTSYNTKNRKHLNGGVPLRENYAIIGGSYDEQLDAFLPPKPHDSWVLNNETADWESPLGAAPELTEEEIDSRSFYRWDEEAYQTDNITGWVLETPEAPAE